MRILLVAASAVALSGCSWLGHMSDNDYYNYGHNAASCGYSVPTPVTTNCLPQSVNYPSAPAAQPSYAVSQTPSYVVSQPQTSVKPYTKPYVQPQAQTYAQPQVQSQPTSSVGSYEYTPVQTYQQPVVQSQPVYTTGGYGSHSQTVYHSGQSHAPLRGYYGVQKAPKTHTHYYVQAYGGANFQHESENSGLTGLFTTGDIGDGTTINVADGTEYGWETEYDTGYVYGGELGYRTHKGWRFGVEGTRSTADVDGHENVTLGGAGIGALDAASIALSPTPLGVTVADLVANGQGEIEQTGVFLNGYYDFNRGGRFTPYVGVGVGAVDVDVDFNPSGTSIINGSETLFGYQGRVGASYNVKGPLDVFTEYTYRATEDAGIQNDLFPGDLDIETDQSLVTVGARYNF